MVDRVWVYRAPSWPRDYYHALQLKNHLVSKSNITLLRNLVASNIVQISHAMCFYMLWKPSCHVDGKQTTWRKEFNERSV